MDLYLILYFLSGFSALIYEVVWARLLLLAFGSTTVANTIVITAFMLGLGLGGLYYGSNIDRAKNYKKLFLQLQLGIGFSSLLLLFFINKLPILYKGILNNIHLNQPGSSVLIFIMTFIILFVPTFLMGGTFPVITKLYVQDENKIKNGIGTLYGLNTLGGVIGALLTGFFFIRNFGLSITQLIAISINFTIGILLFLQRSKILVEDKDNKLDPHVFKPTNMKNLEKYLPSVAALSGFSSLACEIFWMRALSIFLTNSTYTFTIILIVFLTGISIGSIIFTKLSKKSNFYNIFAIIQLLIGLYILIGCLFLHKLPLLLFLFQNILEIPAFRMFLPALILSVAIVFVPTIFMGISFPLICTLYGQKIQQLGKRLGNVYFSNTLGSALGSLFAGLLLIHYLGVIRGLIFIAFINLLIGFVFTIYLKKKLLNIIIFVCAIIITFYSIRNTFILPPSIYHSPGRQDRVLYYKETRDGTVIVSEDRSTGIRSCYVNNSAVIGTTYDALKVVKMLGNLPFIFNPDAREVLVIGFGVGITTSAIAKYDIKQIDCVEICPGLREAAKYFAKFNNYIYNNPLVNFIPNDGRNFLLLSKKRYDIISCDPTHPILGSGSLYTKEYFRLCKEHLSEKGVVCQYLPFHKLSPKQFKSLIKTFADVFPHTSIWLGYSHGILVGTNHSQKIKFESFKNVKDEMLNDPYLLAVSYLLDTEKINHFSIGAKINTDDKPILEFFTPLSLRNENWEININSLIEHRIEVGKIIEDIEDFKKLERYLQGQQHFIEGLIYQNRRERQSMMEAFRRALEINPENNEILIFLQSQ
ncbi:MAG: fused MFS/spermidine synthase [candidate division WOR-3 bacterium]